MRDVDLFDDLPQRAAFDFTFQQSQLDEASRPEDYSSTKTSGARYRSRRDCLFVDATTDDQGVVMMLNQRSADAAVVRFP